MLHNASRVIWSNMPLCKHLPAGVARLVPHASCNPPFRLRRCKVACPTQSDKQASWRCSEPRSSKFRPRPTRTTIKSPTLMSSVQGPDPGLPSTLQGISEDESVSRATGSAPAVGGSTLNAESVPHTEVKVGAAEGPFFACRALKLLSFAICATTLKNTMGEKANAPTAPPSAAGTLSCDSAAAVVPHLQSHLTV